MPKPSVVGERLRELREKRGWSIADLARASGVDRAAIGQVENGVSNAPSFPNGVRLARALEADAAYLAGVESVMVTPPASSDADETLSRLQALILENKREIQEMAERQDAAAAEIQRRLTALESSRPARARRAG